MARQAEPHDLEDVLETLCEIGERQGRVSISDIKNSIGQRSFGPFLLIIAVVEISPIGGIPGLPTALAGIAVFIAAQILFGRPYFWLPEVIRRRSIEGDRLKKALDHLKPGARLIDKAIGPRLTWFTRGLFIRFVAVLCILLALSVPPLELVPFASTVPFATIGLFGLALTAEDGLLVLIGCCLAGGAAFYSAYLAFF
jgi:hypothetical protein